VVADGLVYMSAGRYAHGDRLGMVSAFDAITGELRWRRRVSTPMGNAPPAVAHGIVYAGSDDGTLYAFGAKHGRLLWTATSGPVAKPVESAPVVAGGLVYWVGYASLYAFDANTGAVRWHVTTGGWSFRSWPTVSNGLAYVSSENGTAGSLYAFDALTGAPAWTFDDRAWVYGIAAVRHGVLYVSSVDGILYALDPLSGAVRWKRAIAGSRGGTEITGAPAVGQGLIVLQSLLGPIYARGASRGHPLWDGQVPDSEETSPALANGVVYVSDANRVRAYDARTGSELWNSGPAPLDEPTSPVTVNGFVYVTSSSGVLHAFGLGAPAQAERPDPSTLLPH
jgi:outer membrane protein assembly factor BamB